MNTAQPTFSIIVPVYNTPKGMLEKCVASLISQQGSYEYIFINDGSTERYVNEVLSEAMHHDSRVKYIEKENGGVSAARNDGLRLAKGKYLMFVDADDFLYEGSLDYAYKKAEAFHADVVLFGNNHKEKGKASVCRILTENEKDVLKKEVIAWNSVCFNEFYVNIDAPWAKVFRRDVIDENSIIFPTDINRSEDAIFDLLCYEHSQIIAVDNKSIYSYETNPTSICHSYSLKTVKMLPKILAYEYHFIEQFHRGQKDYLDALALRSFIGVKEADGNYFSKCSAKESTDFITLLDDELIKMLTSYLPYSVCKNIKERLKLFFYKKRMVRTCMLIHRWILQSRK